MQPYQQRVVDERAELEDKISKLAAFRKTDLHKSLDAVDRELLKQQFRAMMRYSNILGERIVRFGATDA